MTDGHGMLVNITCAVPALAISGKYCAILCP